MKERLPGIIAAFVSFILFALKLGASPSWGDPWELTVASWGLGIAHPPGYSLILLLTRLLQFLPLSPYAAAALLSALCSAISIYLIYSVIRLLFPQRSLGNVTAALGAFLFSLLPLGLQLSTVLEVYAPATTITLFMLWLAVSDHQQPDIRKVLLISLLAGISTVVHMTVLFSLPFILVLVLRRQCWSRLSFIIFLFLLGASVGLMQPLRAGAWAPLDWVHPSSIERWWRQVSAAQYTVFLGDTSGGAGYLQRLFTGISASGVIILLFPAAFTILLLWRKSSRLAIAIGGYWLATALLPAIYGIWDISTYYLSFSAITVLLAVVCLVSVAVVKTWQRWTPLFALLLAAGYLLVGIYEPYMPPNRGTLIYGRAVLSGLPPRAVLFAIGHPSMMPEAFNAIDGLRPDVAVVSRPRLTDSMYWRGLWQADKEDIPDESHVISAVQAANTQRPDLADKALLARASLLLGELGWQGSGEVAWTPGTDLAPADYPETPELQPGYPVWVWRRNSRLDEVALDKLIIIARQEERTAKLVYSELKSIMEYAATQNDAELQQWVENKLSLLDLH